MIKGLILLFYLMREWFFVFALAEAHRLSPTSLVHFWQQNNFQILYQTQACRFKKKKKKGSGKCRKQSKRVQECLHLIA